MNRAPKVMIEGLQKEFETRDGTLTALEGIEMVLGENEFVCLVGTSGCGKSTLLSIVAGLQEPTAGEILVDGRPIDGPGRDRGVVFQSYTLFPWMTAQQNVEFALSNNGLDSKERRRRARENLELVGLEEFGGALPKELSGGMKQRVAIARSLSYHPSVLLMDEPFGALDALTRTVMQELLTEVWERHRLTVLFVTHDVDEAVYVSDRVIVMTNRPGRIKQEVVNPLPRPRTFEMQATDEFMEPKLEILESIREESLRQDPSAKATLQVGPE
jgi:NitT/TauT family transport system ATP-binding protein